MAVSHLSSPMGESSKMVPTLTLNCLRHARQVHVRRVFTNDSFLPWQRGHSGPFGHFADATASTHSREDPAPSQRTKPEYCTKVSIVSTVSTNTSRTRLSLYR